MTSTPLPACLNDDTLLALLVRLGIRLNGDARFHLTGAMRLRPADALSEASVTTAALAQGFSATDAARIIAWLRQRGATKA
jgi:hypothetical protein